jgi:microcystin-dependent protein
MKRLALAAATAALLATPANAQDAKQLGEIYLFAGNFCPRGSLPTDGRIMQIANNTALFSIFGTIYGGDGRTTFALPDLTYGERTNNSRQKGEIEQGGVDHPHYCIVVQGIFPSRN